MSEEKAPVHILDSITDGCQVIGAGWKYLYLNESAAKQGRRPREELIGRSIIDEYPGIDSTPMFEKLRDCMERRVVHRFENEFTYPDGSVGCFLLRFEPVPDGVFILSQDISERKAAEVQLRASEQRYRALFENAPVGIIQTRLSDGRVIDVNRMMYDLTGFARDELTADEGGSRWLRQSELDTIERLIRASGTLDEYEVDLHTRDGTLRHCTVSARLLPDGDSMEMLFLDVTARRIAEEERRRLSTAIDQAAEAVIITDAQGRIVYVNPAFEQVSGFTREDAIGQLPSILKSGKQDAAFYQEMWRTIRSGRTWRGRLVNRRRDGSHFTEEAAISPVVDADGKLVNFVCVKRDITRELNLEEQFRQSQKMEAVGQLAGGVAHDFNNLLALIIGYTDVLLQTVRENDPIRSDITEIRRAGERATTLTKQLLSFSRKQSVELRSLDLNQVVAGLNEMLRRLMGTDAEIVTRLGSGLGSVRGDTGMFEQVILNLAINARDALDGNRGRITIETANVDLDDDYAGSHLKIRSGPHVMLSVTDNGRGMDEATKARIFEPFFTTKTADRGTGLGLATVYGIVNQVGGSVWVYSEVGEGTAFKIYLPREDSPGHAPATPEQETNSAANGECILLVEDEDAVRNLTRRLLLAHGYTVRTASSGSEALAICESHGAELRLMLTDVFMPQMSGIELARIVAERHPNIPILFMSGYADNAIEHFEAQGGTARYIGKPFTAAALGKKVKESMGG